MATERREVDDLSADGPNADQEYFVFPLEAIRHLPEEWQKHITALVNDAQGVLETADPDLKSLNRLIHTFLGIASLRFIHHRLNSTKFAPTMEWVFENDMLILAFTTTYYRVIEGGVATGISRKKLPIELRAVHDRLLELRNKRYAHNAGHSSIAGATNVDCNGETFEINVNVKMGFHVGGAREWGPLVEFLDGLMHQRLHVILDRLKQKTGREWIFPSGPPPQWVAAPP